jgi:hypothetical protein
MPVTFRLNETPLLPNCFPHGINSPWNKQPCPLFFMILIVHHHRTVAKSPEKLIWKGLFFHSNGEDRGGYGGGEIIPVDAGD